MLYKRFYSIKQLEFSITFKIVIIKINKFIIEFAAEASKHLQC